MPMTFWAVVSFQRSLPRNGLQVCQQVPLPLSLWELQVRLQNLRQGRVPLPGPHQSQQQPGERARPVCVLLPAVPLSQPGQQRAGRVGPGVGAARRRARASSSWPRLRVSHPFVSGLLQSLGRTPSAPRSLETPGQEFSLVLSWRGHSILTLRDDCMLGSHRALGILLRVLEQLCSLSPEA